MGKLKISPVGSKLLVLPVESANFKTESGIEAVNLVLAEAEIVEIGEDVLGVYLIGDRILFSKNSGISQMYNHKPHIWLDGRAAPVGEVWAIISEEEK